MAPRGRISLPREATVQQSASPQSRHSSLAPGRYFAANSLSDAGGGILPRVTLSIVIITHNEEANLGGTLESVQPLVGDGKGEIIVVDSGSTDRTVEIAKSFGAKVFVEEWKGYAAQKNSAIDKATGDWILSLDADEEVEPALAVEIVWLLGAIVDWERDGFPVDDDPRSRELRDRGTRYGLDEEELNGFIVRRKNFFLGRWIRHGGFWPDSKLRFFRREKGKFKD